MANSAKSAFRSRLAQRAADHTSAAGFHKNPQDFSSRVGVQRFATQQEYIRANWHYMTPGRERFARRLSTKFATYRGELPIDMATGQFLMEMEG